MATTGERIGAENGISKLAGGMSLLGPWGAAAGAALGVANGLIGASAEKRRREKEVEQALNQNLQTRERINNTMPSLYAKQARGDIKSAMKDTVGAALNSAAGGNQSGSFKAGSIATAKNMAGVAPATAQFSGQIAGTREQELQGEMAKTNQLGENTRDRANISQMTDYINEQGPDYLGMAVSGLNSFANIDRLTESGDKTIGDVNKGVPTLLDQNNVQDVSGAGVEKANSYYDALKNGDYNSAQTMSGLGVGDTNNQMDGIIGPPEIQGPPQAKPANMPMPSMAMPEMPPNGFASGVATEDPRQIQQDQGVRMLYQNQLRGKGPIYATNNNQSMRNWVSQLDPRYFMTR